MKQVSPLAKDNSFRGSIATSIIGNEVEKMARKDIFKYSLKHSKKFKTSPPRTFVKLSSKGEATVVSDLLFQRLVVLPNDFHISFDDYKGHNL